MWPLLSLNPINKTIVIYLFLYNPHLVAGHFLAPFCKAKLDFLKCVLLHSFSDQMPLVFFNGGCSSVFSQRARGKKELLQPDLWAVVVQKNSTTGNFRITHSDFRFWNTVQSCWEGQKHLPDQYFKSETEWCSSLKRSQIRLLQNKARNNMKRHVG